MSTEVFFIIICYVFIGFLLILFNLRTTYHWIIKSSLIIITLVFYIFTYKSFTNLVGWPTSASLPERFRLISAQIYEPNTLLNIEGAIYLWVTNMDDLAGLGVPRSFKINYNKELHEKISKSLVNLKNGVPQMGENLDDEKKGIISSLLKKEKITTVSTTLNFVDIPNQLLPEK